MSKRSRFDFESRTCKNCGHLIPEVKSSYTVHGTGNGDMKVYVRGCDSKKSGFSEPFLEDGKCSSCCGGWSCPMKYRSENVGMSRELGAEIRKAYERWKEVVEHGAGDPFWEDGVNANLCRNHVIYYRRECEALLLTEDYPPEYEAVPVPPELDPGYMAGKDPEPKVCDLSDRELLPVGQLSIFDIGMV